LESGPGHSSGAISGWFLRISMAYSSRSASYFVASSL
jgi:hypothetical protein